MRRPSRRELLLGALSGIACAPTPAGAAAGSGLQKIAAERGLLYGTYVRAEMIGSDPDYTRLVEQEAGLITCSCTQLLHLQPSPSQFDFSEVEANYAWARERGIAYHGHNLIWGESAPGWFARLPDRAAAARALETAVTTVCRHFAGRFRSWEIVNEAIKLGDGRPDGLRRSVYLDQAGPEYLDIAFHAARAGDPKTPLLYNEFGFEYDIPYQSDRRRALLDLIDGFKKRGTPIDAIGLQSHLSYEYMPHFNERLFSDFLGELVARGLKLLITELDVADRGAPPDIAQRDAAVAGVYRRYLDVALANRAVTTVISWGLTDRNSWLTSAVALHPEARRVDGLPARPLPFDTNCLPKPAYVAIAEALHRAPPR
jgi:endo-1,4-beta-xylanase